VSNFGPLELEIDLCTMDVWYFSQQSCSQIWWWMGVM